MTKDTNHVRQRLAPPARLDDKDRTLLGLLAEDSTRSYAELGKLLHLSPPAVHERVKRLRQDGVIKANIAVLDGARLGRPLLAFVHIDTTSWAVTRQLLALQELPEVEEIHTVTGESAMLLKVRTRDTQALEDLLEQIHSIEGFKGTRSYIALSTYLERGPSPVADD
ncbi:DNA-binding Lrp family transcriptional regulator [Rhodopseudomonas julia]|uniref:DNA-binding Lrp family transcriptional regulator n=1 Tax=Rhodopseudomonas julia TaxID=200617 RepID=A0ABU0C7L8_9BRAD|nr:Lrp/AsnC family transcriptional regulator [Rhodopseudomonas julia]MDQ0326506.1 DNA-binding Lrp family transcriptional regulator [Rhodopseudomonas julia]